MLHGMIPAAFFATLLRRYLDSLLETPECVESTSTVTTLGTSAAIATAGIAIYGFVQLTKLPSSNDTKAKNEEEPKEISNPIPIIQPRIEKNERIPRSKRKRSKGAIRKRKQRGKQWFLKSMRHYKSKYGRKIGKLMNQLLGIPFTETPSESLESDDSDDENTAEVFGNPLFAADQPDSGFKDAEEHNFLIKTLPDHPTSKVPILLSNESNVVTSKATFDEDDDDDDVHIVEVAKKRSSSLDLKDLLRDNFERQTSRKNKKTSTSRSFSGSSSRSGLSTSRRSGSSHSRSSSTRGGQSCPKAQRRRSTSDKNDLYRHRDGNRRYVQSRNVSKKTRSGKCYNKQF